VEKYCRAGQATDDKKIRRMCCTCWMTKATDRHTLRICNVYCLSTATMVTLTRLDIVFIRTLPVHLIHQSQS